MGKEYNKLFKNATVSVPYNDFIKALSEAEQSDSEKAMKDNIVYLNQLVGEVARGEITMDEATDFELFKTPLGKVILANIQDYKGVDS